MLYFANPCTPEVVDVMVSGRLAFIDTPRQRNTKAAVAVHAVGAAWCADNGAFGTVGFDEQKWWAWLVKNAPWADSCAFATAPDVVGDAAATLERSVPWLQPIRGLGYPAALVAQDGLEDLTVPWDDFDVLFIGGSTEWKLGPQARDLAAQAKARGKWVHMGRVNSERRFVYARAIGCDSVDGTYLRFGPTTNLPKLLGWLDRAAGQEMLA